MSRCSPFGSTVGFVFASSCARDGRNYVGGGRVADASCHLSTGNWLLHARGIARTDRRERGDPPCDPQCPRKGSNDRSHDVPRRVHGRARAQVGTVIGLGRTPPVETSPIPGRPVWQSTSSFDVQTGLPAVSFRLVLFHLPDKALGPHIRPAFFYVSQTLCAFAPWPHSFPSGWDVPERRPQRVLAFVVHQHQKLTTLIVERVCHSFLLSAPCCHCPRSPGNSPKVRHLSVITTAPDLVSPASMQILLAGCVASSGEESCFSTAPLVDGEDIKGHGDASPPSPLPHRRPPICITARGHARSRHRSIAAIGGRRRTCQLAPRGARRLVARCPSECAVGASNPPFQVPATSPPL